MPTSNWTHVCPTWIAGPRSAHPKFGGGVIIGGIPLVEDRLRRIKKRFPDDRSSAHIFLEVRAGGTVSRWDHPNAISFDQLVIGMEAGKYPLWSAMTSPAFGLPGVQNGAILNPDPKIVEIAQYGHTTAIRWSKLLEKRGLGLGYSIWWPAFDSRLHRGPLSLLNREIAVERLCKFWLDLLQKTEGTVKFEYKPSVPGQLDYFPTMQAAITFCLRVNEVLKRTAMTINLEWAHALIGGQTVESATRMQVEAGLFGGLVHVNSAEKAIVEWNKDGTEIEGGTPGDDADWPVGEGVPERWRDQCRAVALLDSLGVEIAAEHDIDPAGEDPMECYDRSRHNLEQMIAEVRSASQAT